LALLTELGPQLGDRRIDIELAAAGQHMRAKRGRALGAGEHDAERVLGPGRIRLGIGDAAPQVDDRLAAHRQADRGADLALLGEVPGEGLGDALEALLAGAVDFHCFGIGSLRAVSRKRAAWLSPVWSMP